MPKVRTKRARAVLKAFPAIMAIKKDFMLILKKPTSIAKSAKGNGTGKKETRKTEKLPYFSINFSISLILCSYLEMSPEPKKPKE